MLSSLKRSEQLALAALVATLVFVLVDQARDMGLQKGHRGWCSANVLAIIERATPQNGFVGYTLAVQHGDGSMAYQYFDRYPVFFSAGMHVVLNTFELSRGEQIHVARQAMNVLYGLTLLAAVALLLELGIGVALAVAAVALAGSGKLLVFYRDMIHFDHAAMLGFMVALWGVARWYRVHNDRWLYAAVAFGVLMGRGYATFAVVGVWAIVEAIKALRESPRGAFRVIALGVPARACVLAIALAGSCLAYNIWREAELTGVSVMEVGIVDSARRRILQVEEKASGSQKKTLAWPNFAQTQAERFVVNVQPHFLRGFETKSPWVLALCVLAAALSVGAFIATRKPGARAPWIVASLAGVAWIFAMRGLTAFHDFTIMFMLSGTVVLMLSIVRFVPERLHVVAALLACGVLVLSTSARNRELRKSAPAGEVYTRDFERIERLLKPGEPFYPDTSRKKVVPGVPYALGWFLPNNPIAKEPQPAHLTKNGKKKGVGTLLTPENEKLFLFRK